jgi:hypothetical protein
MQRTLLVLALACTLAVADISSIQLNTLYLIPEGMDFDASVGYIIGSLGLGNTYKVGVNEVAGNSPSFVSSTNMTMRSTFGIEVDKKNGRNRVLVCVANSPVATFNPAAPFQSGVAVISLSGTPAQTAFHDLSAVGPANTVRFCNDLVADNAGNIYATDSTGEQVWKISTSGVVTTHASSQFWNGYDPNNPGLPFGTDGIEITSSGDLIVGHISSTAANSTIWKVPTSGAITVTKINVLDGDITGADGIYFGPAGCLYVVGQGHVYRLKSNDNWANAHVLETVNIVCLNPTAISRNTNDGFYYVSCANDFMNPPATIERVNFAANETVSMCSTASGVVVSWLMMVMVCVLVVLMMGVR